MADLRPWESTQTASFYGGPLDGREVEIPAKGERVVHFPKPVEFGQHRDPADVGFVYLRSPDGWIYSHETTAREG